MSSYELFPRHFDKKNLRKIDALQCFAPKTESFTQIADMSVWQDVYSEGNMPKNDDFVDHHEPVAADPAGNVCSFGLLMLEIISGKPPYSEHKGSLTNLVMTTKTPCIVIN
jgi:hypothetical protein